MIIKTFWLVCIFSSCLILTSFGQEDCDQPDNKRARKLFDKAIEEYRYKRYLEANDYLKNVIDIEPGYTDAYYVLALINIEKRNYNVLAAEKYLLKVIELCPDYDMDAYYYLGWICHDNERWSEAIEYLEEFLRDITMIDDDEKLVEAQRMLKSAEFKDRVYNNPVPFSPRLVKGVNTQNDEFLFIISPDEEMALFTRMIKHGPRKGDLIQRTLWKEVFMYSWKENGRWNVGKPMEYPFNQENNEGGATLSIDNKTLYYTVVKYVQAYKNADIYYSEKVNGSWTNPKSIGSHINREDAWDSQPALSLDGKVLYFCSDRPGGYGGYDLYKVIKENDGTWSEPINLGPTVNSPGNEKSPYIHADNLTLYFASDGWKSIGGYDIYFIRTGSKNAWTKPRNIGYPINTEDDESSFFVSTNGQYGFFASNKLNGVGGWDLFYFDLYEEARPEEVLFLKGNLLDEETKKPLQDARVELKNVISKKIKEIPVDPVTGEYIAVALFNNDYILTVKKEGYAYESRYFAQEDTAYKKPVKVDLGIKEIEVGASYKLNDIYFATNKYELNDKSKTVIDGFIEFLNENPTVTISIEGHTDNVGSASANLTLSENRAKSVYNYLVENNISQNRLEYKGLGEAQPVADNGTPDGRALNRRTVFVITSK